ncbi:MAG TPA: hypothetical protein VNU71_21805 [Burkholderiaceae bacterium]|nr:hypothetical protein [Burkholderiaceae bacterium]
MSTVQSTLQASSVEQLRDLAMGAAAQGRHDEARSLLESALAKLAALKLEMLSDMAAIALRAGDLVQSIGIARHLVTTVPGDDAARYTLAMGLAAIGSHGEALELLDTLNQGERGKRFHAAMPELAAIAATEAAGLRSLRMAAA